MPKLDEQQACLPGIELVVQAIMTYMALIWNGEFLASLRSFDMVPWDNCRFPEHEISVAQIQFNNE